MRRNQFNAQFRLLIGFRMNISDYRSLLRLSLLSTRYMTRQQTKLSNVIDISHADIQCRGGDDDNVITDHHADVCKFQKYITSALLHLIKIKCILRCGYSSYSTKTFTQKKYNLKTKKIYVLLIKRYVGWLVQVIANFDYLTFFSNIRNLFHTPRLLASDHVLYLHQNQQSTGSGTEHA